MEEDAEGSDLALACLDMITIIIPPALPTCMSVGVAFALSRLFFENLWFNNYLKGWKIKIFFVYLQIK